MLVMEVTDRRVRRGAQSKRHCSADRRRSGPRYRESAHTADRRSAAAGYRIKRASQTVLSALYDSAKRSIFREELTSPAQRIGHPAPPPPCPSRRCPAASAKPGFGDKSQSEAAAVCSEGQIVSGINPDDLPA